MAELGGGVGCWGHGEDLGDGYAKAAELCRERGAGFVR